MKGLHESPLTSDIAGLPLLVFYNQGSPANGRQVLHHWHEHLELLVLEQGSCRLELEREILVLQAGDLVLINACTSHGIPDLSGCRFLVMQFAPEWLQDLQGPGYYELLSFLHPDNPCLAHVSIADQPAVHNLLLDIEQEYRGQLPALALSVRGSLLKLMAWLIRRQKTSEITVGQDMLHLKRVQPAILYVRQHFTEPIDEKTAAARCYLSMHHFCRLFRQATGRRFWVYVLNIRLQEARRRLVLTSQPIGAIALDIGFSSPSHFAAVFRRATGRTPLAYRKQNHDRIRNYSDSPDNPDTLS